MKYKPSQKKVKWPIHKLGGSPGAVNVRLQPLDTPNLSERSSIKGTPWDAVFTSISIPSEIKGEAFFFFFGRIIP